MNVGLRIDVDTFRGTQRGVPRLLRLLDRHGIRASFFFTVGPDNMGRHVWRLIRPSFLWKMVRTNAPRLYGWEILSRGLLGPGPLIGKHLVEIIRATHRAGHEVGLHAWDHYRWQTHLDRMNGGVIRDSLRLGVESLTEILGSQPTCSATPAWKCNELVLAEKESFAFKYNSDCRGASVFRPVVGGRALNTPQIPVDLPTYDEAVGRDRVAGDNFNEYLLALIRPDRLNTLTIHAEVEGLTCLPMFAELVRLAQERGATFVPLGQFLRDADVLPQGVIIRATIPGRDGWVAHQSRDGLPEPGGSQRRGG